MRPVVIIPTYNEKDNLPVIVPKVLELTDADILVVDDGSPDGTGELADELAAQNDRVHVMHRSEKSGLGRAYVAGFTWALARDYSHILEMDADLSHRPIDLPKLLTRADRPDAPDLVIGSRWVTGGAVENWPMNRLWLSRGSNLYVRLATGLRVHDATAGFRVFRREILEKIDLSAVQSHGYSFQVDMTLRVDEAGGIIVEVPIVFVERTEGVSKMDGPIIKESALRTAGWGIARRRAQLGRLVNKFRR
ncbi:polyprenol monophosphomannose synthase [Bowdeniella nasicola]|uniref:polyprenol monophosphomannose synthase n=1 Tax=Bowdeniella nasicola TaxID=208480 RepID=UPI0009F855B1|nr:polyprenol monophosphomannose synthase [Bowdeniella nasicola]